MCASTHHSLVALALTEGGLVEPIASLLHGIGCDLPQGVHYVFFPVPHLWVLHSNNHHDFAIAGCSELQLHVEAAFKGALPQVTLDVLGLCYVGLLLLW